MAKRFGSRMAISRLQKTLLVLLCLLIVFIISALDRSQLIRLPAIRTKTEAPTTAADIEKYQAKTFTVSYVVDGDTIDLNVPDGNDDHTRVRLWGVDTPETKTPASPAAYFGPEASEFTYKSAFDKNVVIYLDNKQTRDKYSRLLAYVQLEEGNSLNENLLSEGFAYADRRFKHIYYNKYLQLESSARKENKGLWQSVTRDQLPPWLQRMEPKLLKK